MLFQSKVQYNDKIKNIKNKMNTIVKEVAEKVNRMKKHVYGAPVPHRSWRNLLLMLLGIVILLVIAVRILRNHGVWKSSDLECYDK